MTTTSERVLMALQPYNLKQEGTGKWRCNSPLRPNSDSHAFTLTIQPDGEHGAYKDHARPEDHGSLYDLADLLHIETNRVHVDNTKREYADLEDYAKAHGVTAETMRAAGWEDKRMVKDKGVDRPALAFKTANGTRYRFIDGVKGLAPYKSDFGYKSCWYGLKRAIEMARKQGSPLVLCNGEVSTIVAQAHDIPAASITNGEKKYPNELLQELLSAWDGAFWIAMDCDSTGKHAAKEIADQLVGRDVTVIDLGLTSGGDLADLCRLFAADARAELGKRAVALPPSDAPVSDIQSLAQVLDSLKAEIRKDERTKDSVNLENLLARAQAEIDRVSMHTAKPLVMSFGDVARENKEELAYRVENPNPIQGLRSNIPSLDLAVGGFEPEIYVILGATSMGKSTLAVSITREFILQGAGFVATTESSPNRWLNKLVGSITRIPSDKIETGQLSMKEHAEINEQYDRLQILGCDMLKHGAPTVSQLRSALLTGMEKRGYEWCIIDSISKMRHPGANNIYDRMSYVNDGIQELLQELNIPFIMTSQVGRDVGSRPAGQKMPTIDDAYGSGVIEHNAGVVLGLYNHQYYVDLGTETATDTFPPGTADARILKNRWRGNARVSAVKLLYVGGAGFYELETRKIDLREYSTNGKH